VQPSRPVFLDGGCIGTPRPPSTSQPSLDKAGHSHSGCHEPPRVPDSPLLWEKYISSPKKGISPHRLTPSLGPGHHQHSKGQFLLLCRESCCSLAIISTLGATLSLGSPARPACNYDQRALAPPALGRGGKVSSPCLDSTWQHHAPLPGLFHLPQLQYRPLQRRANYSLQRDAAREMSQAGHPKAAESLAGTDSERTSCYSSKADGCSHHHPKSH